MAKTAHVIRHIIFEDLGSLEAVLIESGYQVHYFEAASYNLLQLTKNPADLLVVLGGPIGVNEQEKYPFIVDEIAVIEQRIKLDLPTLGICLGSQLLAAAFGAQVVKNKQFEVGWAPLELANLESHAYFKHLYNVAVLHWHGDTFELADNALLHASTVLCKNQAFSIGNKFLGLQFHPEVTQAGMVDWFNGNADEIKNFMSITLAELVAQTDKYSLQLEQSAKRFWQAWLKSWQS